MALAGDSGSQDPANAGLLSLRWHARSRGMPGLLAGGCSLCTMEIGRKMLSSWQRLLCPTWHGSTGQDTATPAAVGAAVYEEFMAGAPPPAETRFERLYVVLISLHGLVRGERMELGRDSDTGGQVGGWAGWGRGCGTGRSGAVGRWCFSPGQGAAHAACRSRQPGGSSRLGWRLPKRTRGCCATGCSGGRSSRAEGPLHANLSSSSQPHPNPTC